MVYKFNIEIPYGKRSQYFDFVVKVNNLVDLSGSISLWVNNNPYSLQSFLLVETNENGEEIIDLLKQYNLKNDTSKGIKEYLIEMGGRKWNSMTVMQGQTGVELAFQLYHFAEEEYLEKNGFKKTEIKRKKLFISYCHADKEIVLNLVEKMENAGLYLWIDKQEIDAGDCIIEKVMSGISGSDLCITFISSATVDAQFAREELTTIWHKVIYNQKKWFIVKLDDVDTEQVYSGLGKYLYYEINDVEKVDEFINAVKRKMSRLELE